MREPANNKACKLKHISMTERGDTINLTVTLSGHETALAQAKKLIESSNKHCLVERDPENNTLKVITSIANDSRANEKAADFIYNLHGAINMRLAGLYMQPDYDQIGEGGNAVYTPAIHIQLAGHKQNADNLAGAMSLEVIKRALSNSALKGYIADPRSDKEGVRLMHLSESFATDTDALMAAESSIRSAEKEFGIFNGKAADLALVSLRTSTVEHPEHEDELHLASARLRGSDDSLEHAMRRLKHRHRSSIAELNRGEGFLDVGTGGKTPVDPTNLLAAIHMTTDCELPIELKPHIQRSKKAPYPFEPLIEAHAVGDASGLQQVTLRHAAARYAGSFIPGKNYSVPEEMDPHRPSQIVVHQSHYNEDDARRSAEELAQRIAERLKSTGRSGGRAA